MKILHLTAMILALTSAVQVRDGADVHDGAKVANFSVPGQPPGGAGFEKLSFWSGPRGNAVEYAYGSDGKLVRLRLLGRDSSGRSFAVRFPNGLVLDIAADGDELLVSDRSGRYRKRFAWHYEGPIDGRGTFCAACVPEPLAVPLVRENFMQAHSPGHEATP